MAATGKSAIFDEILRARHSCRAFLPTAVKEATINSIVEMAQRVPSWCNAQPWQLLVTRPAATEAFRNMMARAVTSAPIAPDIAFPARYAGVYKSRRSACGWQLYQAVGVTRGDRAASGRQMMENYRLFGAPHVAIVTSERDLGAYGVLDCGAFVSAFMLAAETLGVASIAQAAIAGFSDQVRAHFELPDNRRIICAISFGFEDKAHPANAFRTPRAPSHEVIDWR